MNYIYPITDPEILKLGIKWALYDCEQSFIAYLKEPEFKEDNKVYYRGTLYYFVCFIEKKYCHIIKDLKGTDPINVLLKYVSHYYPGQQVESFKYVEEVLQNWCTKCDKAHVDFKCPDCGDSTYYVDKLSWQ